MSLHNFQLLHLRSHIKSFIRGSKHLETIKALGLWPRAFITFSVFGTPDETLALVFDILRNHSTYDLLITKDTDSPVRQTNQNSNKIHIADNKPGIKLVSQLSSDLVLFLTE